MVRFAFWMGFHNSLGFRYRFAAGWQEATRIGQMREDTYMQEESESEGWREDRFEKLPRM